MAAKDVAKEFPSVFQYGQSQRDFINSLIEVTFRNDMRKLDVKSCSQLLTVETVKVKLIIYCYTPCSAAVHKHWSDYGFVKFWPDMFSYSVFPDPNIIQVMKDVVESCCVVCLLDHPLMNQVFMSCVILRFSCHLFSEPYVLF